MAEASREEINETVESLVVDLRGIAQPHEIAQLRELALDAAEADTQEQLEKIAAQVESLRNFCLSRARSSAALQLALPILKRQRA